MIAGFQVEVKHNKWFNYVLSEHKGENKLSDNSKMNQEDSLMLIKVFRIHICIFVHTCQLHINSGIKQLAENERAVAAEEDWSI